MNNKDTIKYVSKMEDLPAGEFWVICKMESVSHEGDERSRTNPGHGYPAHTDHFVRVYAAFTDEEEFKLYLVKEIKDTRFYGSPVRGFKFTSYNTKTVIEVSQS